MTARVEIAGSAISDWDSFHTVFAEAFGFPGFYGENMNAWIDCMSYLDKPGDQMTNVHVARGEMMLIVVRDAEGFKQRCPDQFAALVECADAVNDRRTEVGDPPLLELVVAD